VSGNSQACDDDRGPIVYDRRSETLKHDTSTLDRLIGLAKT
jgi:hypothetical protein